MCSLATKKIPTPETHLNNCQSIGFPMIQFVLFLRSEACVNILINLKVLSKFESPPPALLAPYRKLDNSAYFLL